MSGMHFDISDRVRGEEALRELVAQKERFVREIHHRVKNNLNVISSLLNLQLPNLDDEAARQVFLNSITRIRSITMIHEKLMRSSDLTMIDLNMYLGELAQAIFKAYAVDAESLALELKLAELRLEATRAMPLGLILNELLTNSLKYAFPDGMSGTIGVRLEVEGDTVLLDVSDDGVGLPDDQDPKKRRGVGMTLIELLAGQIGGSFTSSPSAVGPGRAHDGPAERRGLASRVRFPFSR
jgi:two-component sensor histidine kinase